MLRLIISAAITATVCTWLTGPLNTWERALIGAGTLVVSDMLIKRIQTRLADK